MIAPFIIGLLFLLVILAAAYFLLFKGRTRIE